MPDRFDLSNCEHRIGKRGEWILGGCCQPERLHADTLYDVLVIRRIDELFSESPDKERLSNCALEIKHLRSDRPIDDDEFESGVRNILAKYYPLVPRAADAAPQPAPEPIYETAEQCANGLLENGIDGSMVDVFNIDLLRKELLRHLSRFRPRCDRDAVIEECAKAVEDEYARAGFAQTAFQYAAHAVRDLKSKGGAE